MIDFADITLEDKLRKIRAERYAAQSVAKKALPKERVSMCLRRVNGSNVQVLKHLKTEKAFYKGLMVCGSVWNCPICAAKISERRKKELELAFSLHKESGGKIALLTLTFSHKKTDKLTFLLNLFSKATAKLFSGKAYNNIREKMGLLGRVRVHEVTYGKNGFHPHLHIGLFYQNEIDLDEIKNKLFVLWQNACIKFGLSSSHKHGLDLQSAEDAQQYLSKHGTWSLEQELSKSHIKKAKHESLTPFDFLRKYLEVEDEKLLKLFKEYADAFKGKRHIQWSQGLKKHFLIQEKSDEQLVKEETEQASELGLLTFEQWKYILKHDMRSLFLDYVEKYGYEIALFMVIQKKESSLSEDSKVIEI